VKKGAIYTTCGLLLMGLIGVGLWKIYAQLGRLTQEDISKTNEQLVKTTKDYMLEAFSNKYSRAKEDFKIEVLTETGNFAKGTVNINNEHSGGLWFAVKRSGGWNLVYEGNGIMPCDIADGNNLPVEMVPGCLDTQQGNSFVQRQ
jgi:hypothetical protein